MSDLIDKQAVIDLWDKYYPYISVKAAEFDCMLRKLPSAQPEPSQVARDIATIIENEMDMRVIARSEITDEQAILHLQASGWMQRHDKEMYESGLRAQLADDNDSYDALLESAQPEQQRTFVELVVEYPKPELCTYKEYKGKPYYSIKYIENGETHIGYGTYKPEVLSQYLKENFISSAQPDRSCIDQIKWERDTAIQQLNELGYGFGEAIRHDKDVINRKGAINAVCTVLYPDADKMNDAKKVLKEMPSAQPEYYDYSDIEPLWKSFAEENDINLTSTAKQLKDAMWCGYRKGKADAQPELCEDADKLKRCRFEYVNACKTVTYPTPDTRKNDIYDAYAVIKALRPIFGDEEF